LDNIPAAGSACGAAAGNEKGLTMAKILVTGGAGYLGSVLCEVLVNKGHHVVALDNLMYGQTNPLFNLYHTEKIEFVYGDVTNEEFMRDLIKKGNFDFVIPLAALVGFQLCEQKPEYSWMVNAHAIETIVDSVGKDTGILMPMTNSGYGSTDGLKECTEDQELKPISVYGKSKCAAEAYIRKHAKKWIIFRLATLYGTSLRQRTDLLVNNFVWRAMHDRNLTLYERHFKRNFVHVRDAANAFAYAIENFNYMKNEVYNLGHPNFNISKLELANMIKKELPGISITIGKGNDMDKRNYIVSNRKIMLRGFKWEYPLDRGIRELIAGYRAMKDLRYKNYEEMG